MTKALSMGLRGRVVAAVDGGLSRNKAAARFGVSIASAVRWCSLARQQGDAKPKRQGGDRKTKRIEAHGAFILAAVDAEPDITLKELQALLLRDHKQGFGTPTLWRFFARHGITLKKSRPTRASRSAPMS